MQSINEAHIRRRIANIYDVAHGAQSTAKGIKDYVKALEKSVDIHRESMGSSDDFLRDFGGGI